jgi:hypothetical protein
MNMESDDFFLFVSHVTEDRAAASQVVDELERRGVRCWIAPRNVRPGSAFDDDIADAIGSCRALLLIFSSRCNDSEYIRREITVAGNVNKVIIPFRIENVEPKRGLSVRLANLHWIDAFVARERAIDDVVRSVQSSSDQTAQASRPAASDEAKARWTPPEAQPTSTVALPVKTLQRARVLTLVGSGWLALMALRGLVLGALAASEQPDDWQTGLIVFLVLAVLCGGCAAGTYFNSRVASLIGFVFLFVVATWGVHAASPREISGPFVLGMLLPLPVIAGIIGTFATARLLHADKGPGRSGAV